MVYPGSKSGNGVYQGIINNIPWHTHYYEPFAGTARIFFYKRRAQYSLLSDIDPQIIEYLQPKVKPIDDSQVHLLQLDAMDLIDNHFYQGPDTFLYADPPYTFLSRRSARKYYRYEQPDSFHLELLPKLKKLKCNVMISSKGCEIYMDLLKDWRYIRFQTADRVGPYYEYIHMNYPEPQILHQYNYLGKDFTDRQRISRKITRLKSKLSMLPEHERNALLLECMRDNIAAAQVLMTMAAG